MNPWTPSFITAKKLLTSFSLVCLALSIPVIYLIYASSNYYNNQYQSTLLETKGSHIVGVLLNHFSLLSFSNNTNEFEKNKNDIKSELITKNILNLSASELREAATIFAEAKNDSRPSLARDYYGALIRFVGNYSNLILDPDSDSYYFMDVLIFRLPRIYSILANIEEDDALATNRSLKDIQGVLGEIEYSLRTAMTENKKRTFRTHYNLSHVSNLQSITDEIDKLVANKKKLDLESVALKSQVLQNDVLQDLRGVLQNRNTILKKDQKFILMVTLGFWFFGIISGYFLFVKILKDHSEILKRYSGQSKKLADAEKLSFVGEIATSIAHEVKNPLTIIDYEASSVRKILHSEHPDIERANARLTKISEMSSRINKVSNLITAFARKSNNDPFETVPLKKILDDILYLTQLKSSKLDISIEVSPLECDLSCRPIELEQVFINLINNAIDAIEPLSVKWIKIQPRLINKEGEEWIIVRIIDSGNGIKKEVADSMFNSFFTTKASGKGTGLGFSIARRIIEDHRGKIYYDEHSEHTAFVVEIPKKGQL